MKLSKRQWKNTEQIDTLDYKTKKDQKGKGANRPTTRLMCD